MNPAPEAEISTSQPYTFQSFLLKDFALFPHFSVRSLKNFSPFSIFSIKVSPFCPSFFIPRLLSSLCVAMAAEPQVEGNSILPCQTLYVTNLNEKIKKVPLRKALLEAFSTHGRVIEIVALRGNKLRGQAWVSFEHIESATNAMAKFQGHPFFEKPIRINYAKSKSDIVAKKDGTYKPREKRKREEASDVKASATTAGSSAAPSVAKPNKIPSASDPNAQIIPSNTLFAENLPKDCDDADLSILFKQHTGFKEVRMVPGKEGIAFIEFENEHCATIALQALNGFKLTPTNAMSLTYRL